MTDQSTFTQQRQQLERVLSSAAFQSSKQTRDFLAYVSERVFAGSTEFDQTEIAQAVLGRVDFDPTTDASVRKLATSVRQRLEKYYEGPGAADEVIITLPLRSYAPHFELRPVVPVDAPVEPTAPRKPTRRPVAYAAGAVLTAIAVMLAAALFSPSDPSRSAPESIRILTATGDITSPGPNTVPGAVRLGPAMGSSDQFAAEVTFRPEHEGQHAGILIMDSSNRYIALGRRFSSRNFLSFTSQEGVYNPVHAGNEVLDPEGQSGHPVWLRLSRHGDVFTAWYSYTGHEWVRIGTEIRLSLSASARAGVFAFNGRRSWPSIPAEFRLAGKGPALSGLDETLPESWQVASTCPNGAVLTSAPPEAAEWPQCQTVWRRNFTPARGAPWSLTTRVDAQSAPGVSAGLFVQGLSGRLRLVRYHGESPSISLIVDGRFLQPSPDFPGSPPVYLRLRSEHDAIVAECSGFDARRSVHRDRDSPCFGPLLRNRCALGCSRVRKRARPAADVVSGGRRYRKRSSSSASSPATQLFRW